MSIIYWVSILGDQVGTGTNFYTDRIAQKMAPSIDPTPTEIRAGQILKEIAMNQVCSIALPTDHRASVIHDMTAAVAEGTMMTMKIFAIHTVNTVDAAKIDSGDTKLDGWFVADIELKGVQFMHTRVTRDRYIFDSVIYQRTKQMNTYNE